MVNDKSGARAFLEVLENAIVARLPAWQEIKSAIPEIVETAKGRGDWKHKREPESAFLNHYALPVLFQHISEDLGYGRDRSRQMMLSESFRHMREMSCGSPARAKRYSSPFGKVFTDPRNVIRRWAGHTGGSKLQQPCPDFALRSPFPHTIVFEGKYFSDGGIAAGETHLVEATYQAFFYGAQPPAGPNAMGIPWDYDYSCLFACDTSEEGSLVRAWKSLTEDVRAGFWEGANIYVMILRPE